MNGLNVANVWKKFAGAPVLHGVDLQVERGTLLALLGPSGSGKTTLLRVVCGFMQADAGTIDVEHRRVAGTSVHVPAEQRRIGYVAQEGALFPHLSVAENIVFGLPRAQRRARHRVAELLELVGLPQAFATRAPQQLSGGQQQRVALARALAPSPMLVMLDEPFSSLDAALRVETRQAVAAALEASGATAILVTHDQAEALSLGREVAVLWQGTIIQTARPEVLYRRPVTSALASFIGEAVMLAGVARGDAVDCALGTLPLVALPAEGNVDVDVMIRPEQITLTSAGGTAPGSGAAIAPVFEARVTDVAFFGQDASIGLHMPSLAPQTNLRARVPGYMSPHPGDAVRFTVQGEVMAYPRAKSSKGASPRGSCIGHPFASPRNCDDIS